MNVKIVEKLDEREVTSKRGEQLTVAEFLVGDETGAIILSLWNESIKEAEIGETYDIEHAYVNVFRNSMRLSLGRRGIMKPSEEKLEEVNTENNVSDKHVQNPRSFRRF